MSYISNKAKGLSSSGHIAKSFEVGNSGERRFYDSCQFKGLKIKKTSSKEDMKHVDFIVDGASFDVKGLKNSHKKGLLLLELKNVQGKLGWCNDSGSPEFIAFDFGLFFLCVKNLDLFNLTKECCDLDNRVDSAGECFHKGYSRRGREDLMTMVSINEAFASCEHWILPYEEFRSPMKLL
tara:strand:+ start:454 stop:993 length:540 start_codon:yes stop_codon:yes gene_type:complete